MNSRIWLLFGMQLIGVVSSPFARADEPASTAAAAASPREKSFVSACDDVAVSREYRLLTIPVRNAAAAVTELLAQSADTTPNDILSSRLVTLQPLTNQLVVFAPPPQQAAVIQLLQQLDQGPQMVELPSVITLIGRDGQRKVLSRPVIRCQDGQKAGLVLGLENGEALEIWLTARIQAAPLPSFRPDRQDP